MSQRLTRYCLFHCHFLATIAPPARSRWNIAVALHSSLYRIYGSIPTNLNRCLAEEVARDEGDRLHLHGRPVVVGAGGHGAVGRRTRSGLPLQQLQDGVNVWHQLRLQPGKGEKRGKHQMGKTSQTLQGAEVVQARRRLQAWKPSDGTSDNEARVGGVDQAFTVETTKTHSSGQSN